MNRSFSWKKAFFLVGLRLFLLWFPQLADAYFLHLTVAVFLAMILASSWDILARTGQVSVGQAGLFGIGAYAAALLYQVGSSFSRSWGCSREGSSRSW